MLEKQIEKKVCDHAKQRGWKVYKFTSPNNRSVPDRLFLKGGIARFIEFKREGCKPTPGQAREIELIREKGFRVDVIDNVRDGELLFD
jgi:hypothetical protein